MRRMCKGRCQNGTEMGSIMRKTWWVLLVIAVTLTAGCSAKSDQAATTQTKSETESSIAAGSSEEKGSSTEDTANSTSETEGTQQAVINIVTGVSSHDVPVKVHFQDDNKEYSPDGIIVREETAATEETTAAETETVVTDAQTSDKQAADKQTSDKKVSDQQTTNKQTSDKQTAETQASEATQSVDETPTVILTTDYSDPIISISDNNPTQISLNHYFDYERASFNRNVDSHFQNAIKDNKDYGPLTESYYLSQNYETERNDAKVVSFKVATSDYTGGAHGNYVESGLTFDVRTGKKLALSDLGKDSAAFQEICKKEILSKCAALPKDTLLITDKKELEKAIDSLVKSDQWYLTKSGIKFVANPYELAAYAEGTLSFTVPYYLLDFADSYSYEGNFEQEIPIGDTVKDDLDGDGKAETVLYNMKYDYDSGQTSVSFEINGRDYSGALDSDQVSIMGGFDKQYYLTDLDSSDPYIEIAIPDSGDSDDPVTYFFRYDGKKLSYLGNVPDMLSSSACQTFGDGTILANTRLSVLETAYTSALYQVNPKGKIELVEQPWYDIEQYSGETLSAHVHEILQDVTVYKEPDQSAETMVLTANDGPVKFPRTDNKNWVEVEVKSGAIYYLYLTDFSTIQSGKKKLDVSETFSNIFLAD